MEKLNHKLGIFVNFDTFLNEAARTKFPAYKVGDLVIISKYHEFQWKTNLSSKSWETYTKYVTSSSGGMIGKIAAIDNEKKEYAVEFIAGVLRQDYRGNRRSTPSYIIPNGTSSNLAYLRVKQNQLETEGIDIIQKLLKDDPYTPSEKVSVKISGEKSVTRRLIGVSIAKSIENKKLTYLIDGVSGEIESKYIEKEISIEDETSIDILAEEIAKVLKTKYIDTTGTSSNKEYVFDIAKVEGKELIQGTLYFKNDSERDQFCDDLQKFIDKKLDKNFQKVMNRGESSDVKVIKIGASMRSWHKGTIYATKIVQAAKNLGINVKEFLEKSRGKITGKKFGL
jgi:hypothetical protein